MGRSAHVAAACSKPQFSAAQTIEEKERGASLQPGMLPSWAVPAIEGIPEAIQAASKKATDAAKDAVKDAVKSVVAAGSSPFPEKVRLAL